MMMERLNPMEETPRDSAQIFDELGFVPVSYFSGSNKYPIEADQPIKGHVFSGSLPDGTRAVVKTGHFNGDSVEKEVIYTKALGEILAGSQYWVVRPPLKSGADHIVYPLVQGTPLSKDFFWDVGSMSQITQQLRGMEAMMNTTSISVYDESSGRQWWRERMGMPQQNHIQGKWMAPVVKQNLLNRDAAMEIIQYLDRHATALDDIARIYRDPNGDHFFLLGNGRTEIVDVDISYRPRHYMEMRYLAWALLNTPKADLNVHKWVGNIREVAKLGADTEPTFVVSLIGTLWDISREIANLEPESERYHQLRMKAIEIREIIESIIRSDDKE